MIRLDISKQLESSDGKMTLHINTSIQEGDFIMIYGESGVGKTSLLRMISGLMQPDKGSIHVKDEIWFLHQQINLSPQKRKVGFVFQDYALFPNMTVRGNIEFAMRNNDEALVDELLEFSELQNLQQRFPHQLSGGQKQRLALIRALAGKPQILLLDEPLSAVDYEMRKKLRSYIQKIHKKYHITTIMVSHDHEEIRDLGNRVIHLKKGKIEFDGLVGEFDELKTANRLFARVISFNENAITVKIGESTFTIENIEINQPLQVNDEVLIVTDLNNKTSVILSS